MIVVSFEKFIVVAKNVVRIFSFINGSVEHEGNSWKCTIHVYSLQYSCVWMGVFFHQTICKVLHQELLILYLDYWREHI